MTWRSSKNSAIQDSLALRVGAVEWEERLHARYARRASDPLAEYELLPAEEAVEKFRDTWESVLEELFLGTVEAPEYYALVITPDTTGFGWELLGAYLEVLAGVGLPKAAVFAYHETPREFPAPHERAFRMAELGPEWEGNRLVHRPPKERTQYVMGRYVTSAEGGVAELRKQLKGKSVYQFAVSPVDKSAWTWIGREAGLFRRVYSEGREKPSEAMVNVLPVHGVDHVPDPGLIRKPEFSAPVAREFDGRHHLIRGVHGDSGLAAETWRGPLAEALQRFLRRKRVALFEEMIDRP